jgi:hypothetical protein
LGHRFLGFHAESLGPTAHGSRYVQLADPGMTAWQDKMTHGLQAGVHLVYGGLKGSDLGDGEGGEFGNEVCPVVGQMAAEGE